jgi:hypothetical protein
MVFHTPDRRQPVILAPFTCEYAIGRVRGESGFSSKAATAFLIYGTHDFDVLLTAGCQCKNMFTGKFIYQLRWVEFKVKQSNKHGALQDSDPDDRYEVYREVDPITNDATGNPLNPYSPYDWSLSNPSSHLKGKNFYFS